MVRHLLQRDKPINQKIRNCLQKIKYQNTSKIEDFRISHSTAGASSSQSIGSGKQLVTFSLTNQERANSPTLSTTTPLRFVNSSAWLLLHNPNSLKNRM